MKHCQVEQTDIIGFKQFQLQNQILNFSLNQSSKSAWKEHGLLTQGKEGVQTCQQKQLFCRRYFRLWGLFGSRKVGKISRQITLAQVKKCQEQMLPRS